MTTKIGCVQHDCDNCKKHWDLMLDHIKENTKLRAELREGDDLRERLAGILTRSVNVIRGEPEPMSLHSWHDLPELVEALKADAERLEHLSKSVRCSSANIDGQHSWNFLFGQGWTTGPTFRAAIDAARSK